MSRGDSVTRGQVQELQQDGKLVVFVRGTVYAIGADFQHPGGIKVRSDLIDDDELIPRVRAPVILNPHGLIFIGFARRERAGHYRAV